MQGGKTDPRTNGVRLHEELWALLHVIVLPGVPRVTCARRHSTCAGGRHVKPLLVLSYSTHPHLEMNEHVPDGEGSCPRGRCRHCDVDLLLVPEKQLQPPAATERAESAQKRTCTHPKCPLRSTGRWGRRSVGAPLRRVSSIAGLTQIRP